MSDDLPQLEPVTFADLPGWGSDDLEAALSAYLKTCPDHANVPSGHCLDSFEARTKFFEEQFTPHKVIWSEAFGHVTGYYEPVLKGSRVRTEQFNIPLYKKPDDLVALIDDKERAKFNDELSYMRQTPTNLVPFPTRKEIETGALEGLGFEILYLEDRVETFFLHVQGAGLVELPDGSFTRVTYAAKNGHPFSSIGKVLLERGEISKEDMCLEAIDTWLRSNEDQALELMWINKSFIFFSELSTNDAALGARGAADVPLTPEHSLAVDASIHALGTPIWLSAPELRVKDEKGFQKLMIAQDVGSAIKGPERGDIYWGSGPEAGRLAGNTNHKANFFVLLPNQVGEIG